MRKKLIISSIILFITIALLKLDISIVNEQYTAYLNNTIKTILWLTIGYIVNLFINNIFWQKFATNETTKSPPRLLVQLSSFFAFLITISLILYNIYEYPVTTIWAASGALGLVVGFALKNLILDTFSGLAISLEKPFKVGDWINCHTRMGNYIGQVVETNWRTTRLYTSSKNMVVIPNSYLTGTLLTNYSMPSTESRFAQIITLDFSVETNRALRIIDSALHEAVTNGVLLTVPKPPKVKISEINEYGVQYKIKYFINPINTSPSKASDKCLKFILNHLMQAGISPSYPKQDVYNADMPWRQKDWNDERDIISLLRKLSLFKMLQDDDLKILAENILIRQINVGDVIVKQGESGDSMFIVAEGYFDVFINNNDEELKVANISPGSFFGEKSLLTGEFRSATIKASKPSMVGEISKDAMKKLLDSNQSVVDILGNALANRELSNKQKMDQFNSIDDQKDQLEKETNEFMNKIKNFFSLKK